MIEPPSFSSGKAFCTVNSVPLTLMLNSLSKCSSVTAPKGTNSPSRRWRKQYRFALHVRDSLVKTIKVSQLGNVSLNPRNVGADFLHGLVEFLLAAARDEDIGTLFDEKLCRSQPNPSVPPVMTTTLRSSFLGIVFPLFLPSSNGIEPPPNIETVSS